MLVSDTSVLSVLRERASLQPNDTAFTFIDYERDWNGDAVESLTWMQLFRRTVNLARHLEGLGSVGDRAVILAPQGLEYIVAFLGSMQAGMLAVPLSVPLGGVSDERVASVMSDALPSVVLTTSTAAQTLTEYVRPHPDGSTPTVVEVDLLDLDGPLGSGGADEIPDLAYLQYTSGSTRSPAGVMMSHRNIITNFEQWAAGFFADNGNVPPPGATVVSWLPFYHDMGLYLGICAPILLGIPAVLMSPVAFLQRPARWMQLTASHPKAYTAGPNFAFELAVRKTSDDDMAGLDLGDVLVVATGSERVHPATLQRFTQRFSAFNLRESVIRPSYGLAEATIYVATSTVGHPPSIVRFDSTKLTMGTAEPAEGKAGTALVSYGVPTAPTVRIVDPDTGIECPAGTVGEIWVYGENVAAGYWNKPDQTEKTFGAKIVEPSDGTPEGPWLRTGDSGFLFDDELFIIGRIKDLLIVYGRNHSPDDIEATIQEITHGRCAAIAIPDRGTEQLVVIVEARKRGESHQEIADKLTVVKREVTSAISSSHGLSVADLVLVSQGSIPITTSGKVRRSACVEKYREGEFARLDA